MKKFTIQLQNINGEVELENEVTIEDNDILIMQYPEGMTLEQAQRAFEFLNRAVETGGIAGIPNTITFKVIRKG